jgi:DNA-binding CsgD family transcriptional regulator
LRSAATVEGNEHFADPLTTLACAASPIVDPFTSALLGVVDLTCTTAQSQSLMLAMARNAAWNIAERMVSAASISDRVLLEQFLRARRTSRGPLVAITPQQMLTNAAAAPLFGPEDRAWLWEWTQRGLTADGGQPRELDVGSSTLTAFCEPVRSGHEIIGALVRVTRRSAGEGDGMAVGSNRAVTSRPVAGWSSLRESELGVAELVAQGLSNREVAARLYVSPHTVDFHLRQIFRKLSIRSRVELARLVVDHADGHGGDLA